MGCRPVSEKQEIDHRRHGSLLGSNSINIASDRGLSAGAKNKLLIEACLCELFGDGETAAAETQVGKDKASRYKLEYTVLANGKEGIVKRGTFYKPITNPTLAYDQIEKRDVAIKTISLENTEGSDIGAICLQTRLLHKCNSPYIIKLYDAYEKDSTFNLVFEYAAYGDLWAKINRQGALSEWAAANITQQILLALKHLHDDLRIVHWYDNNI